MPALDLMHRHIFYLTVVTFRYTWYTVHMTRYQCAAGSITDTFLAGNARQCTPCAAGKYSLQSAVASCTDCSPGKYRGVVGGSEANDCLECKPGHITNKGTAEGR